MVAGVSLTLFFAHGGIGLAALPTITANSGAFETVVPPGFINDTAAFSGSAFRVELAMGGPTVHSFVVNINVVRERTTITSVGTLAQESMVFIKRTTRANDFSTLQDLTVDGAPARAFGYLVSYGRALHQRQVYVIHDGWGYVITYTALPGGQYHGSLPALSEALRSWRWR